MSRYSNRSFSRSDLPALLELVSNCARSRWPTPYLMNSDVIWRLPGAGAKQNIRLWFDGETLLGYAWFAPGSTTLIEFDPAVPYSNECYLEAVHWAEARARDFPPPSTWLLELNNMQEWAEALEAGKPAVPGEHQTLLLSAYDADEHRQQFLETNGYTSTAHKERKLAMELDGTQPELPDGIEVRAVREDELEARCELHRRAWTKSTFSMPQYKAVRSAAAFDPDLDVVSVEKDGAFSSYCIGWADYNVGAGSFEPVGTHADYRAMGRAEAVIRTTLYLMHKKGLTLAKVGTAGFNDPALSLYQRCGFVFQDHERTWTKHVDT